MKLPSLFLLIMISLFFVLGCLKSGSKNQFTELEISAIANKEAKNIGLVLERYALLLDQDNSKWKSLSASLDPAILKTADILDKKDYQAICFQFRNEGGMRGNNIWLFIDKKAGTLLTTYSEELPEEN